jgi:hypothetical protein
MAFVVSKMASDMEYVFYSTIKEKNFVRNNIVKKIVIKGGAGVVNSRTLIAPDNRGVFTEITEEDAKLLETHPVFKRQNANGFVAIVSSEKSNIGATEMQIEDDSAQLTAEDFAEEAEQAENNESELKIADNKVKSKGKSRNSNKRKTK